MTRTFRIPALALTVALAALPAILHADVKFEQKSLVTFGGTLGRVINLFGGKATKEGIVSTIAVSGDRRMSGTDTRGEIIDLREEKIYDLDMRKKTYTVTTFEEVRRKMEEMEAKARENAAKQSANQSKEDQPPQTQSQGKQYDVDFDVKDTGQTKTINGFDTRETIVTVTVREKGKKLEDSGGVVMTVDNWLTRSQPALKEIRDFEIRSAQKLAGPAVQVDAQQLATALAMMPGLKEAFARYNQASLDGTVIQTSTTIDGVKSAEQLKQEQAAGAQSSNDQAAPTSVGGVIGGFMKRRVAPNPDKSASSARSTFMTISNEVLRISTSVSASDVAIPAEFKLSK